MQQKVKEIHTKRRAAALRYIQAMSESIAVTSD